VTVIEIPSGAHTANRCQSERWLGGRFRLDERISLDDHVTGPCGSSWEARGFSLWKASDRLLGRPVTIYLLPQGVPVPRAVIEAVQSAAKVTDPRLAAIYDTDFNPKTAECPYVVSEWAPGTPLEDLVLSGPFAPTLPGPALAAAMIADAADAIAVAHQAGRPHLRLTPRSLRWDPASGLKITGLGLDAALCGATADPASPEGRAADTMALARMLYALLTGYWPGDEATAQLTALPPAPRYKGSVCTPRQVRAGVPAMLDAITYRGLCGQAADAPLRAQTPAGLAMALRLVQRPSYQLDRLETEAEPGPPVRANRSARPGRHARHARGAGSGFRRRSTLLRPAV